MNKKFDMVLMEKPSDEGLTRQEVMKMLDMMKDDHDIIPIELDSDMDSVAMGFISNGTYDLTGYDHDSIANIVSDILNDMNLESENSCYSKTINATQIEFFLGRSLP